VAVLRTVFVWPPSGFPDRPWCDDPGADAFAKVSRAICDRYSEALATVGLVHKVGSVRIIDRGCDQEGVVVRPPGDEPLVSFVGEGRPEGFERGHVALPAGFAGWPLERQQITVLDVVHDVMVTMAAARGIDNADRLERARHHVLKHQYTFSWISPWRSAPRGRGKGPHRVPLSARVRYRLEPNGFGVAMLEVGRTVGADEVEVIAVSREHPTWTTDKSFKRSARTLRWSGPSYVSVVPYVTAWGQIGPTVSLALSESSDESESLEFVEGLGADSPVPRRTVQDRARDVTVPAEAAAQASMLASRSVADRVALAGDPGTGSALVAQLALDPSPAVRRIIAAGRRVAPEVLRALVTDHDRRVREELMRNPATPDDVVVTLVADPDRRVRWSVLNRSAHPAPVLLAMAQATERDLRWMTAERIRLDPASEALLARDDDETVRHQIARRTTDPTQLLALLEDPHPLVRGGVLENPAVRLEHRLALIGDPSPDVRLLLVGRRPLPLDACLTLARDRSSRVRQALARASWAPDEVIQLLLADRNPEVVRQISLRRDQHSAP
jgi:hypothetical protein